mgnify:CR=1 FL=1|jgi:dipeptidyl-peptidase 4
MKLRNALLVLAVFAVPTVVSAQSRFPGMPGYERFTEMAPRLAELGRGLSSNVSWSEDSRSVVFERNGARLSYDLASRQISAATGAAQGRGRGRGAGPARGRQAEEAASPDGVHKAIYRDRNIFVSRMDGSAEAQVTTDGSEADRIKYGTASWVYGEELEQVTAMWWSPDGSKLAFYRFDETPVQDFFLQMTQTEIQSSLDIEAYPKAGTDNPLVDLFIYDVASGEQTHIDARSGLPLTDDVVGHYVYAVEWSPDGSEITFNRTNRRQNVMEFTACSPETGSCRVVIREEWSASWTNNRPSKQFLDDGQRFIWSSERNGWKNFYLYDMSGELLNAITQHDSFEAQNVVRVDETKGELFYMARSGDNYMKMQLHRVGLDGRNDERLTDPAFNHRVAVAPSGVHFVDVSQTHDSAPETVLRAVDGRIVATLAARNGAPFDALGLEPVEMFTFHAADGVTELHGMLHKPSNFDPNRRYPMLVSVYAGPATNGANENFTVPNRYTEAGFLYLTLDARSAGGKGKRALDPLYENMGIVEIDDLAAGVRALWARSYVDRTRVGIFGTSYGGYSSAMAILRYPDVFQAASASSSVTDWRHYDTIYTERYMYTPQANAAGYDAGAAMTYAANLEGDLLLYYGTADNNVHPNNTMQLIAALQAAGKTFEVQVGPDRGHTSVNADRMMEFFIQHLVIEASPVVF